MNEDIVRFVLEKYLAENLINLIMQDIKAAEEGESDDVE